MNNELESNLLNKFLDEIMFKAESRKVELQRSSNNRKNNEKHSDNPQSPEMYMRLIGVVSAYLDYMVYYSFRVNSREEEEMLKGLLNDFIDFFPHLIDEYGATTALNDSNLSNILLQTYRDFNNKLYVTIPEPYSDGFSDLMHAGAILRHYQSRNPNNYTRRIERQNLGRKKITDLKKLLDALSKLEGYTRTSEIIEEYRNRIETGITEINGGLEQLRQALENNNLLPNNTGREEEIQTQVNKLLVRTVFETDDSEIRELDETLDNGLRNADRRLFNYIMKANIANQGIHLTTNDKRRKKHSVVSSDDTSFEEHINRQLASTTVRLAEYGKIVSLAIARRKQEKFIGASGKYKESAIADPKDFINSL